MNAIKKKSGSKKSRSSEFSPDREFAVVLEDLSGKFDVFGEDLQSVKRDVGVLKDDVSVLKDKVSILDLRTKAMFDEMKRGRRALDDHEKRIVTLESPAR